MKPFIERLDELYANGYSVRAVIATLRSEGYRFRDRRVNDFFKGAKSAKAKPEEAGAVDGHCQKCGRESTESLCGSCNRRGQLDSPLNAKTLKAGGKPVLPADLKSDKKEEESKVKPIIEIKGDPADFLLSTLIKRKENGITAAEFAAFPEWAPETLSARGVVLGLRGGRIILERDPSTRISDVPIEGVFPSGLKRYGFAILSDSHFGSRTAQPWFVKWVCEEAARRKYQAILHCGDLTDGSPSMHKGFVYELALQAADRQADYAAFIIKQSPLPWYGIGGNHDGAWFKESGFDVLRMIEDRADGVFHNVGPIQGWVAGPNGDPDFIRMFHPGDGCSYALSYKDQKTAEYLVLQNDKVPTGMHFTGHYHKQNIMRGPNGARYFLVPSSCGTTDFMKARRLINQAGAYFIEFTLDKRGKIDNLIIEDKPLWPDQWTRCDYGDYVRPKREPLGNIWK